MVDPLILDGLVRGAAIGVFAVIGAAMALSPQPGPARWVGAVFFATAIGHSLANCQVLQGRLGPVEAVIWLLSVLGSGMFWTFAVTLFSDDAKLPPQRLIPPVVAVVLGLAGRLSPDPSPVRGAFWLLYGLFAILLVMHAAFVIWRGWRGDLVEQRRRLRAPVMGAAAAYVLLTAAGDLGAVFGERPPPMPLLQAFALAALAISGALALLRLDPALLGGERLAITPAMRDVPALEAIDETALTRLYRAMDDDEIWRREDLTIGALADHLSLPEHRLRRLINRVLGHRNFASFVNARRVEAAKAALGDPDQARKPVSAIAYDLGFGSLGPFNRAFKAATGVTPTTWRQTGASPIPETRGET
ncbi:helix-turn-helix domain-containing protein [Phenylobacterium sp. LH3H17]|uniref:helix-turn-helix domain-containing protein n=1 Tax=Phenylobacterium sp. LH3H17 TaxID=2903901 RepID=UPI0020C9B346|nr:helix-turn-helix domain-containing protein [Phenylobacterium sp. LH3H17]UTP39045.1 helix-turn-helix domain-containing protein [Phenylobacterium sp. LH3H17]